MPKPLPPPKKIVSWKLMLNISVWIVALGVVFWGARMAQAYLTTDPHFTLECKANVACPMIEVRGAVYTNPVRLQAVFAADFGKSLYQIPLVERRSHLLAIDWVSSASVTRIWPNKLSIQVTERKPIAFAKLPVDASHYRMSLVDANGVFLSIPLKTRFQLPILSGVNDEKEADRKIRIEAMQHLLEDLGPDAKYVSEINLTSLQDLRLVVESGGQAAELVIGDQHYRARLLNFVNHFQGIRADFPGASVFDLREDGRILAR